MKRIGILILGLVLITNIFAQQKKIYIALDDHTDFMWSSNEEGYKQAFLKTLDYYIHLNDSTAGEPYPYQSKWNCDGSYWVYTYEKNRSKEQFANLIRQMKEEKITVPLNTLASVHGIAPAEATLRDMYYAGSLERKYGLDLDLVINMEDQVLPLGLSSLWAGAGAKYTWRGVCNCATKVSNLMNRPHEIYWYKGLDDRKVLMKWYSLVGNGGNEELGGYAEARDPAKAVERCKELMNNPAKYPYAISGAFGKGWDDLLTMTPEFMKVAKDNTNKDFQVIVSNEVDFFRDFEKQYGAKLPSESVSYGSTEWGIGAASIADVSASVKRSMEKLRAAEAMYTIVALKDPGFAENLKEKRENAWLACGLYFEHDWTGDGGIITGKHRADWHRKLARQLIDYVDTLYSISLVRMGELVSKPSKNAEAFFAFNPLGWARTDYCDYPYQGSTEISVFDKTTAKEVPFQFISKKGKNYLRILARDIPSLGYKVFEISSKSKTFKPELTANVAGGIIENRFYKISMNERGVITSFIDKKNGNREYVAPVNKLYFNDLGTGNVIDPISDMPLSFVEDGPVSVTLKAESYKPIKHTSKITLFKDIDRVEIENYITQNFGDKLAVYSFSFNTGNPEIWHEEAGAILLAKPASKGGHYADSICRVDWMTLNHFADISGNGNGMILSNRDAYFMKPGNSTVDKLDYTTPQINVLAGGRVDADKNLAIENQDGDSYFENFFAFRPYNDEHNPTSSMKFALEHQNPMVAGNITGKTGGYGKQFSLFSFSDPNVLVWSVKPSEEGIANGIILRVWNMANNDIKCKISGKYPIEKCYETTHIETHIEPIVPAEGKLIFTIGHNKLETFSINFQK